MKYVLIINSGSSSLKFNIFNISSKLVLKGIFDSIGSENSSLKYEIFDDNNTKDNLKLRVDNHEKAFSYLLKILNKLEIKEEDILGIGHRVVHGGDFKNTIQIDLKNLNKLKKLSSLAPLHNPNSILGIEQTMKIFTKSKIYACFDTVFFKDLPAVSSKLPIKKVDSIRRYGFHGLSYSYLYNYIKKNYNYKNIILCHIGNGASMVAIKNRKVIDTTMGLSPLEGLIMGSRSGDIDPEVIFYLQREKKLTYQKVSDILNKESGLLGLCGTNDMRIIWDNVKEVYKNNIFSEPRDKYDLAYKKYIKSLIKYISYFKTEIGSSLQAIVFSGGIGEEAFYMRESVCKYFDDMVIDKNKNFNNKEIISKANSKIKVLRIPTNEEIYMFDEVKKNINK